MLLVDSNAIGNAAPIKEWIKAIEQAFIDTARGLVEVPDRTYIDREENALILMPCFGEAYFSTKLVLVIPENPLLLWMAAFDLCVAKLIYENLS